MSNPAPILITYRVDRRYSRGNYRIGPKGQERWDWSILGETDLDEAIKAAVYAVTQDAEFYDWSTVTNEVSGEMVFQCGNVPG